MKKSRLVKGLPFEAVLPEPTGEMLNNMDDLVFYEVAVEKRDEGIKRISKRSCK